MVDVRYVILGVLVVAAAIVIKKRPDLVSPVLVALAVGTFAVLLMFPPGV
jgi:hypothetical protein